MKEIIDTHVNKDTTPPPWLLYTNIEYIENTCTHAVFYSNIRNVLLLDTLHYERSQGRTAPHGLVVKEHIGLPVGGNKEVGGKVTAENE